jgi:KDO2-lipid IV(A) lauroyltransferase
MRRLWQRLAAEGTRVFEALLRSLPPETLASLLGLVGRVFYVVGRRRRRIALENLRMVFGDRLSESERRRIAAASFESFGRTMAETLLAERQMASRDAVLARMRRVGPDWAKLEEDVAAGRGGMIVTAHMGNWEVSVPFLRHIGMHIHPVVRTMGNPYLDAWATESRAGPDGVIRKGGAVRQILAVVRRGGWVGYLGDQNAGRHGLFVPFFGLEASTFPVPGLLATRFGWPVYIGVCVRRPRGRFDISLRRVPAPPSDVDADARILWVMRFLNAQLERWIEADPDQYTWLHRRWKTRPPGEAKGQQLPAYPHKRRRMAPRPRLGPDESP